MLDLLDGALSDTAGRRVDDAEQRNRILRRYKQLQIGEDVLYLGPLVEAESSHDQIFSPVAPQRLLDLTGLKVGAVKHRDAPACIAGQHSLDRIGDEKSLVFPIGRFVKADLVAFAGIGPEPLSFALGI